MYNMNRYIYEKEKERELLVTEGKDINAIYAQVLEQIRVSMLNLEQLVAKEKEDDGHFEKITASHDEIIVKNKESIL